MSRSRNAPRGVEPRFVDPSRGGSCQGFARYWGWCPRDSEPSASTGSRTPQVRSRHERRDALHSIHDVKEPFGDGARRTRKVRKVRTPKRAKNLPPYRTNMPSPTVPLLHADCLPAISCRAPSPRTGRSCSYYVPSQIGADLQVGQAVGGLNYNPSKASMIGHGPLRPEAQRARSRSSAVCEASSSAMRASRAATRSPASARTRARSSVRSSASSSPISSSVKPAAWARGPG
jgi:hypothetical protein